jgi:hypothetical protein
MAAFIVKSISGFATGGTLSRSAIMNGSAQLEPQPVHGERIDCLGKDSS